MATTTVRVTVTGRVQGVYFRAFTQEEAERLGLTGWVRNLPDRSVQALLHGEEKQVERMIAWLHHGSPHARVQQVVVEPWAADDEELAEFAIRS